MRSLKCPRCTGWLGTNSNGNESRGKEREMRVDDQDHVRKVLG